MNDAGRRIAVAVVIRDGSVLVGRRAAGAADAPGLHEFPGGKVERDETPAAAAAREAREEAGLEVTIGPLLDTATAASRAGPIEIFFLEAAPVDPSAPARAPFDWVPIGRLGDLAFPAANRVVIDRIRRGEAASPATGHDDDGRGQATPAQRAHGGS